MPYSRISGIYFAERSPNSNSCAFYGDNENEFTADTNGLKVLYLGKATSDRDTKKYMDMYDNFIKAAKK